MSPSSSVVDVVVVRRMSLWRREASGSRSPSLGAAGGTGNTHTLTNSNVTDKTTSTRRRQRLINFSLARVVVFVVRSRSPQSFPFLAPLGADQRQQQVSLASKDAPPPSTDALLLLSLWKLPLNKVTRTHISKVVVVADSVQHHQHNTHVCRKLFVGDATEAAQRLEKVTNVRAGAFIRRRCHKNLGMMQTGRNASIDRHLSTPLACYCSSKNAAAVVAC